MVEAEAILFFIMGKSRGFGNQEKVPWLLIPDWLVGQAYHFFTSLASQIKLLLHCSSSSKHNAHVIRKFQSSWAPLYENGPPKIHQGGGGGPGT